MASPIKFLRLHSFLGFHEPIEIILIVTSALLNAALWASTAIIAQLGRALTPLHYTIYFGIDLTGSGRQLYLLPGLATLIFISHLVAAQFVKHQAWRQAWLVINLVFQILLAVVLAFLTIVASNT
jgi:uncharacterized membrane protein